MIKVHVRANGRKYLQLYWYDDQGQLSTRSSKCTNQRDAHKVATALEAELNGREVAEDGSITWSAFRDLYSVEHLDGLALKTSRVALTGFRQFERIAKPKTLGDISSRTLSAFVATRRTEVAADTVARELRHLRHALGWAASHQMIAEIPKFPKVAAKRLQESKGRALTDDEFDRMIKAIPSVVEKKLAPSWERLLKGLNLSGLRLEEAIALTWVADGRSPVVILTEGDRPRVSIQFPTGSQKSRKVETSPGTPDFAELLAAIPEAERGGRVFAPASPVTGEPLTSVGRVGRIVSAIGKAAEIVVDEESGKFASAHDLRRTFATRWAVMVQPVVLKGLLRHANIATTMRYYVGIGLDQTHNVLEQAVATLSATLTEKRRPAETT